MTEHPGRCAADERADGGFTLPELLITVILTSMLMGVLVTVFSVVLRTGPVTEARVDDARSLLGLSTYLPLDVTSAAESGFVVGDAPSACAGVTNAGTRLVRLQWTENADTYVAEYRFVDDGDGERIQRVSCVNGGGATRQYVSGRLERIAGAIPVRVTLITRGAGHAGLEFEVDIIDPVTGRRRELISLDARTQNIPETLPPLPTDPAAPAPSGDPTVPVTEPPVTEPPTTVEGETTTTSTTTTTTTTTTLVPPCVVTNATISPATVENGNADTGKINNHVEVAIVKGPTCGELALAFDPDPTDSNQVQAVEAFNGASKAQINKNTYNWHEGVHELQIRDGSNGPVLATVVLTVT